MRVLLTGATGFIGSHLVPELLDAGHLVTGLSRSDAGAEALRRAGAQVVRGDVNEFDRLRLLAEAADGVIHTAFNHDFSRLKQASEDDRRVIQALGEGLAGSDRRLIVTSGTGLVRSTSGEPAAETDDPPASAAAPRAATEEAAAALVAKGLHVMVMRLPQVHDARHQGRIALHIKLAKRHGFVGFEGGGQNRLPAAHVSDVVRLYRAALERGRSGARHHAVSEEGVALRDIAEAIGAGLKAPVRSLSRDEAEAYFGWMAELAAADLAASSDLTRKELDWAPEGPKLLNDLMAMDYNTV